MRSIRSSVSRYAWLGLVVLVAACTEPIDPNRQPILSIIATPDSFDLPLTTSRTITVQLVGPDGVAITNRTVIWSSANTDIAVVSATGLVTAVSSGTTTISARADSKVANVRVRVTGEPVNSVRITPQQSVHVVRLGQSKQLTAECLSATQQVLTGRQITWNSSNPVAASVDGSGLVSANALGNANITATCDNAVNGSVTIQVTPVPVSTVTITPSTLSLTQGTAGQLLATARDSAGNLLSLQGRQVVWTSNNIPVAQVSGQGVVSGNSPGSAQIQVSVDGVISAPVTVTVHAPFALGIELDAGSGKLEGSTPFNSQPPAFNSLLSLEVESEVQGRR